MSNPLEQKVLFSNSVEPYGTKVLFSNSVEPTIEHYMKYFYPRGCKHYRRWNVGDGDGDSRVETS